MTLKKRPKKKSFDIGYTDPLRKLKFMERLDGKLIDENITRYIIENAVYDDIEKIVTVKVKRMWDYPAKAVLPALLWKYTGTKKAVKLKYDESKKLWTAAFK